MLYCVFLKHYSERACCLEESLRTSTRSRCCVRARSCRRVCDEGLLMFADLYCRIFLCPFIIPTCPPTADCFRVRANLGWELRTGFGKGWREWPRRRTRPFAPRWTHLRHLDPQHQTVWGKMWKVTQTVKDAGRFGFWEGSEVSSGLVLGRLRGGCGHRRYMIQMVIRFDPKLPVIMT